MVFRRKIKNINNKIIGGSKYELFRSIRSFKKWQESKKS